MHCGIKMSAAFATILGTLETLTDNARKSVDQKEYEIFCNEFIFEKIKGRSFGETFCKKFGLNDTFLKNLSDETARYHIEKLGYIKK